MSELDLAWSNTFKQLQSHNSSPAWIKATRYLNPRGTGLKQVCDQETLKALQALEQAQLQTALLEWYLNSMSDSFDLIEVEIQARLRKWENDPKSNPEIVAELLHGVGVWMEYWQRPIETLWSTATPLATYRRRFLSSLFSVLPPSFSIALTCYLRSLLSAPTVSSTNPNYSLALPTLVAILDRYEPLLFALIYEEIEKKVEETCRGQFKEKCLSGILEWLSEGVMTWVSGLYARAVEGDVADARKMLKPTFARFEYHIHKTLCHLRVSELYDMILHYPSSELGLKDLEICLHKTEQPGFLINSLVTAMSKRLLHPGVDTNLIIVVYISTMRSLRILDSQGVLLSRVAGPIREYLRNREDTIRCIVSSLTEEGNDLGIELASSINAPKVQDARDEAENYNDPKWTPDPIDAPLDFRKSKGSDIIQSLVSIYDTKDVFVKELQVRLAQQLLAIRDYGLEREIKNVEILKTRFGESSLSGCEVMINDLQDSSKIDASVQQLGETPLHATIVSRLFWPSFQTAPLKLPGVIGQCLKDYEKAFTQSRPEKKLRWLPQLGTIGITLELTDRSLTMDVTPLQAAIIESFSEQADWEFDDLSIHLRVTDSNLLRNGLFFWNNHGVLKSSSDDIWTLLEVVDTSEEVAMAHVIEEVAPAIQGIQAQEVEQMRVFWQYIQGMLTNLKAMPINRVHSMLGMLVPTYKGHTIDQLEAFLTTMVNEGVIEKSGNEFKIVK